MKHSRIMTALAVVGTTLALVGIPTKASAIPYFARKYKTTCARCHVGFPKLNAFGRNFQLHGYQIPGDSEVGRTPIPEDPNLSLLEQVPLGFLVENKVTLDKTASSASAPSNFATPDVYHIFAAGTIAPDIGLFGELANSGGVTDIGKFNVSFNHLDDENIHLQIGQIDLTEHGITEHNLFTRAGFAAQDINLGGFQLSTETKGIRLYGLVGASVTPELIHGPKKTKKEGSSDSGGDNNGGGATDSGGGGVKTHGPHLAVQDKADPAKPQAKPEDQDDKIVEEADPMDIMTGFLWEVGMYNSGSNGSAATRDTKDVAGRLNYYFGGQDFIGVFAYRGQTMVLDPTNTLQPNDHHLAGVDFNFEFGKPFEKTKGVMQKPFLLFGSFLNGRADNPNADGNMVSWNGYFLEGDYVVGQKGIFLVRYDKVNSNDLSSMNVETLTFNYTYFLHTNVEIGLEYTRDMTSNNQHLLGLVFNYAF